MLSQRCDVGLVVKYRKSHGRTTDGSPMDTKLQRQLHGRMTDGSLTDGSLMGTKLRRQLRGRMMGTTATGKS